VGRYLAVPAADSHEGYRDMEAFSESVRDERLAELLIVFRRCKDVLGGFPVERTRWFAFKSERLQARARAWLNLHDIETVAGPEVAGPELRSE
jgi:hypothetical protein